MTTRPERSEEAREQEKKQTKSRTRNRAKGRVKVRRWTMEDIPELVSCHEQAYDDQFVNPDEDFFDARSLEMQLTAFPEGQFLAEIDGTIVGYASSLLVQLNDDQIYTYDEMTGAGTFSTHTPGGDTLYGADIVVHPEYRRRGIARLLYKQRVKLMRRHNLRRMVAYGRLPGYHEYAGQLTASEYVNKVILGELEDPALNAHLRAGYHVRRVLLNLFPDEASLNYATLLEMNNPDYKPERHRIASAALEQPVRRVRVCAAQYQLHPLHDWHDFERSVEFFVHTADAYHCHFLLFPELFTVQLLSTMETELEPQEGAQRLADMTDQYIALFKHLAMQHQLYIIGGSHPVRRDGILYNVSHLFTPAGNVYTQDKLHITPWERDLWGVRPGQGINVFRTPWARIAIQICYDIEFPEIARLLTLAGVEAIFVPFSTDEKKAYTRVRITAHARAIENYIYTVIAGNVGNLPSTKSYLLNYGQAAVFTPSDFSFAPGAILGEADDNAETVVIAELDLNSLAQQRELGSVRPLYDRRPDLYELRAKHKIKVVNVE